MQHISYLWYYCIAYETYKDGLNILNTDNWTSDFMQNALSKMISTNIKSYKKDAQKTTKYNAGIGEQHLTNISTGPNSFSGGNIYMLGTPTE